MESIQNKNPDLVKDEKVVYLSDESQISAEENAVNELTTEPKMQIAVENSIISKDNNNDNQDIPVVDDYKSKSINDNISIKNENVNEETGNEDEELDEMDKLFGITESDLKSTKENEEVGNTCPICLGEFTDTVALVCGHCMCYECLKATWTGTQPKMLNGKLTYDCPICKVPIDPENNIIYLYNLGKQKNPGDRPKCKLAEELKAMQNQRNRGFFYNNNQFFENLFNPYPENMQPIVQEFNGVFQIGGFQPIVHHRVIHQNDIGANVILFIIRKIAMIPTKEEWRRIEEEEIRLGYSKTKRFIRKCGRILRSTVILIVIFTLYVYITYLSSKNQGQKKVKFFAYY